VVGVGKRDGTKSQCKSKSVYRGFIAEMKVMKSFVISMLPSFDL